MVFGLSAHSAQFKFKETTLTIPDGFEIELIAESPLVERPITGSFDEQGRLYLTDSSGSNDKPADQLEKKPHRIVRLEDTDGDGKFDKTITFADKMMFPEGCLWHEGSLYVSAPPSIWKLTDTNSDGIADVREEWHKGQTLTGCANDLHGPYLGPDGWFYWCKGAFQKQTYELGNGKHFESRAAHIFRARPDHSGLEPVMTGGMDNPVGLTWTPEGERILCGTFFEIHVPGHRDGIIHAVYGGVYGKINEVTDEHKKTGDLMPVMTHMGPAAPCSVIRYESAVFGKEYRDNLFVCSFNLHKVSRHILEPNGATFKTKDSDFLSSDNPDFHPTDVIEDADGSLIVINTGGWYKICCPTSQLSKPDVLGAVYRVRRAGAKQVADPRGLKIPWRNLNPKEMTEFLGDERVFVQRRAVQELAKRGEAAVPALTRVLRFGTDELARAHDTLRKIDGEAVPDRIKSRLRAVWALTQIEGENARSAVRTVVKDSNPTVRCAALQSSAVRVDQKAADGIGSAPAPLEQRIYFELLGRLAMGDQVFKSCKNLVQEPLLRPSNDRVLQHSFSYALIESRAGATAIRLMKEQPNAAAAALIALDQMDNGGLDAKTVAPMLSSSDPDLKKAAMWVAGHHPNWGGEFAAFFQQRLEGAIPVQTEQQELTQQLIQFASNDSIQQMLASVLETSGSSTAAKQTVLQVMAGAPVKQAPASWAATVRACLTDSENPVLSSAVSAARALSIGKTNAPNFSEALLRIAREEKHPAGLRLEALAAIPGQHPLEQDLFTFVCANVDPSKPVPNRNAAVTVLARARLKQDQLVFLTDTVKTAGPLEMTKLLTTFEHSTNEEVGLKLVAALKDAKGLSSLRPDLLKTVIAKYPASVQQQSQELIASLNVDAAKQGAHIEELLSQLKDGDIRRGQLVFNSQKAACYSCHAVGYLGGKVGPDLTSIGQARTERDLLESIVYPSASFVRSYEPYVVSTRSDDTYSGVLKKDAPDEIILATGPNAEVRVARTDIVDIRPGTVSVMPAGLEQQLTKQELADLLAFLKSTKWGPK